MQSARAEGRAFTHFGWFSSRVTVRVLCLLGALPLAGCTSEEKSEVDQILDESPEENVTVFSWWTEGGEQAAWRALVDRHEAKYPDAKVINATADFGDKARDELEKKLTNATPPDLFQANSGADQMKWVLFNDLDDKETKVESVDFLIDGLDLRQALYPEVLEAASFDGRVYGIGLNVHRINSLIINKKVFARCQADVPTTLAEFRTTAETLKTCGVTPIALGNKWNWTLSLLLGEAVVPAMAGGEGYLQFWQGKTSAQDAAMLEAISEVISWSDAEWFNQDNADITWSAATARLRCEDDPNSASCAMVGGADGVAGMTIMGDWAKGALEDAGWVAGTDFDIVPFPPRKGVDQAFVHTSDTFPLPKGANNREGAIRLLSTMLSKDAQIAFNRVKGSIPSRSDVDPAEFDAVQQQAIADFNTHTRVSALSGIIPPRDTFVDWAPTLKEALADGSPRVAERYLQNHYAELQR